MNKEKTVTQSQSNRISRYFSRGISRSLLMRFVIISVLPMAFIAIESIRISTASIKADQFKTLTVLEKSIHNHFSDYINATITNIQLQAELANTIYFLRDLKKRFKETGLSLQDFIKTHHWHNLQAQYGSDFSRFLTTYHYTDVLLLDDQGNILYSSHQFDDLGTNLFVGPMQQSKMARAAKKALATGEASYSDLQTYLPLGDQISGFIFKAVIDDQGKTQGLLAIHLDNQFIERIMGLSTTLDHVGEAFIVGQDLLMRSNARFSSEPTLLKRRINNPATRAWVNSLNVSYNEEGHQQITMANASVTDAYINHDNIPVFGSYLPIDFAGVPLLIVTEVSQEKTLQPIRHLIERLIFIVLATLILVLVIAVYSARSITRPIVKLTSWAKEISLGQLNHHDIKTPVNEIGILNNTFVELVDSLQEIVSNLEALSLGHLGQKIAPKSNDDVLVLALNHLNKAMYSIVSQAETIANGSYVSNISPRSDNDLLGNALVKMTSNLRKADLHNAEQDWIKTSQAELSKIINGDKDLGTLANEVIGYITRRMDATIGTIYVVEYPENADTLLLQGGYAIEESTKASIKVGEGLVGQAAKEQTFILLQDLPADYLHIHSTLGRTAPTAVIIFPFCANGKLTAVIEIASFCDIEEKHLEFIRLASESVAIAFKSCFIRIQTENLLQETQQQSEELKNQQEELRISNENLRTNTQTLQAQQKVLEKAQIQALEKAVALEEASKYKSEFLANMSHELRTPLNSLLILARSLAENENGNLSSDEIESAEVILDSGYHLLGLINDVLDLSKIEAGQMTLHYEQMAIVELTNSMNNRFNHMAAHKGIAFTITVSEQVPQTITTDSVKLTQILTNLISNALKFTDIGEVKLNIFMQQSDEEQLSPQLVFQVIDSGVGIAYNKQSDIFSAFVQEDGSTSRNYGGTGLGLSIVSNLAELLGGEIELESQPDKGSTFSFLLPLKNQQSSEQETQQIDIKTIEHKPRYTPPPFIDDRKQLNSNQSLILIIEDDNNFAKILFNACHQLNCQAIVASDGETGLTLLRQHDIDGIVLDYMLPGLDGDQILNHIKTEASTAHIPVHVISALDNLGNMTNLGALGQAVKPINSAQLVNMIQSLLPKKHNTNPKTTVSRLNLLIVEDDMSALFATRKLLQDQNVSNTGVGSGEAALEHLKLNAYDVMILDLNLPDISGFELLESIQSDSSIVMPQVIIYSGRELSKQELTRLEPFTDVIIVKSNHSPQQLLDEVSQFVENLTDNTQQTATVAKIISNANQTETPDKKESINIDLDTLNLDCLANQTILLVDDDMRNTFALAKVLRNYHLNVKLASSGMQCLEMLATESDISLVLMDIMMPQMDGFETMKRIRQQLNFESLPLIAVTANAMPDDKQKCLDAGANDYLAKPVDIDLLLVKLNQYLQTQVS